jgi:hypothetical protein
MGTELQSLLREFASQEFLHLGFEVIRSFRHICSAATNLQGAATCPTLPAGWALLRVYRNLTSN